MHFVEWLFLEAEDNQEVCMYILYSTVPWLAETMVCKAPTARIAK